MCGFLLNGVGGWGHVWATLRLRLRLGIVLGWGILKFKCFGGMFDTHILRNIVEQSGQGIVSRPDNLARKQ